MTRFVSKQFPILASLLLSSSVLLASGCKGDDKEGDKSAEKNTEKKKGETGAKPGEASLPPVDAPAYDPAKIQEKLQGTWIVGKAEKPNTTYVFEGDKATVTMHRMIDSKTGEAKKREGRLQVNSSSSFSIIGADKSGYKFNFAEIEGSLHIGAGDLNAIEAEDAFVIEVGMREVLKRDASGCTHYKLEFDKSLSETKVECSVAEENGQKLFKFQVPDSFKKGQLKDEKMVMLSGFLASQQMLDEKATKQQ